MTDDDHCKHDLAPGTCSICSGRDKTTAGGGGTSHGPSVTLDTPAALEKYRARYLPQREETFEAYVEVFFRLSAARQFPGGWTAFSRCPNAEPKLVARSEEIMRLAGYQADDSGRPRKGRRWLLNG